METGLNVRREGDGRGMAAAALGAIVVITVAWWALALYPVGAGAPEWLLRTRAACFGTTATGLPHAGGWILLVGEPLGMAATLYAVWGEGLRRDLKWMASAAWGQVVLVVTAAAVVMGSVMAGQRVTAALAMERVSVGGMPPWLLDTTQRGVAMSLALRDQHGALFDLREMRGRPVVVTFAFGHCETVCPTIVREVRAVRDRAVPDVPLLVVTVDPWRDVPERFPHLADQWEVTGTDRVLGGEVEEVLAALARWGVSITRDPRTGDVAHPGVVMVVDREGRLAARLEGDLSRLEEVLRGT